MGKKYGYCRISRPTQNIERQVTNILSEFPDAKIIKEVFTGAKIDGRKEFNKLLKRLKSGDIAIFDSVSRMSRSADEGVRLYFELYDKGITLIFLKEPYINTDVYKESLRQSISSTGDEIADVYIEATNKVIRLLAKNQIVKAFEQAEKELLDLRERTKEGIREARANGKQIGAVKGSTYNIKKKEKVKSVIRTHARTLGGSLKDVEVMKLADVSEKTYYKYKKEVEEELRLEQEAV